MSYDPSQLIAELPVAVCLCEADGAIRCFNRQAAEIWGREPRRGDTDERFCGSLRLFRLDGSPLLHSETPMAEVLAGGGARAGEVVIERPDGSRVTVSVHVAPLHDAEGQLTGAINVFHDVTSRRAAEQAEEDSARLAAIVASAEDAIVSESLAGIITSWNRAAQVMYGYSAAEAVGRPITLILPPERQDEEREILDRLQRGETVEHFETVRLTKDGRRLPVSLTVSLIRDGGRRVIGASKIARDITERGHAEAILRATVQTLEALYHLSDHIARARGQRDVCEAGVDAVLTVARADRASVLVFDQRDVMRFVAWRGLSDRYRAAVDGHSPWTSQDKNPEPILVEDAARDPRLGELREVIADEGIRSLAFVPLVYQNRLHGKFMLYYDAPHAFVPEELRLAATIAQHVGFGLARVRAEEAIEELLERERTARKEADSARAAAERASHAKDEFLAMLAHELRNPLGVIVNAITLIDGRTELPPEPRRASAMIRRQAEHLTRLLDDLLDVARITSGHIELKCLAVDLGAVVRTAVEAQRHHLDRRRQRLHVALPQEALTVVGDSVRLHQVVGNLLSNASKYTPDAGSIWITVERESGEAVLRVRDNGTGIPADKIDTIFELFAQANPSLARTEGGLGIGLTVVKQVVELHGGRVGAHSDGAGKGAELTVRLPLALAPPAAAPQPQDAARPAPRRILVVEDHDDGREMLALTLEAYGHEVLQAATGREAIELAAQHSPDVVLVDIGLPDIEGYAVGRELRQLFGARVHLIALTGYGQPQDRARSQQAGFDAHLVKPVEPAKLAETLQLLTLTPSL